MALSYDIILNIAAEIIARCLVVIGGMTCVWGASRICDPADPPLYPTKETVFGCVSTAIITIIFKLNL